jgi:hypothetical protein
MQRFYRFLSDVLWRLGFEETSFKLYLLSIKRRDDESAAHVEELPAQALKRYEPVRAKKPPIVDDDRLRWN